MSWNESGNQQDPWGKPKDKKPEQQGGGEKEAPNSQNQQEPPNLEEAFNNLLKKVGSGKGGGNAPAPSAFGKFLPIVIALGAVIWGVSGFYTIKEAERGVVTRFGVLHHIEESGLKWKPTFIDSVTPVNIGEVSEVRASGAMLTKDENMVQVELTVQYRIDDPAKFLFSVTAPRESLKQATDSALRYVVGHMKMDDILTTGRAIVREKTWAALNEIIKSYDMGLLVTDVNFQYARPPEEVKAAFDDAIKAQEDEQRLIREAEAYARGQEPVARGNAQRIMMQASAYQAQVELLAQGEAARFEKLLPEYHAAPQVTRERLYLQTLENVMKNTPKVLMSGENGQNLTVLPLEKLFGKAKGEEKVAPPAPTVAAEPKAVQAPATPVTTDAADERTRKGRF